MNIFYRLSDGSYPKVRFEHATKERCLRNFLKAFTYCEDFFTLVLDNVSDETYRSVVAWADAYKHMPFTVHRTNAGSSAGSFRLVLEMALNLDNDQLVYFVEDDYAHLPGARQVLLEGLDRAHYVTLYNHPDKYLPARQGGNPLVGDDGAETTKVFVTPSSYWMLTNSTTMTFAASVETLRADQEVWWALTEGSYPQDMNIFLELRRRGRSLIQPIPTKATHCEPQWAAKLIGTGVTSWEDVLA